MQLSDVLIRNHPTCALQLHLGIQPDPGCGSLFWDVLFHLFVPSPPWADCDPAHCLIATGPEGDCCTLSGLNQHWAFCMTPASVSPKHSLFTAQIEIQAFLCIFPLSFVSLPVPKLHGTPLGFPPFAGLSPTGAMDPA